ncbi:MAG: YraN family protein [Aquificaceae bacterium]|nr:YraN family protein [Aquificaceae bacterium]MDW8096037.1 YraN family protein [Aquificaceae bacterium]
MRKGAEFEELAVKYLQDLGYKILHRNYHCRFGEIDIIALDGNVLVFVEVKGGRSKEYGDPAERIDERKMRRILLCVEDFLQKHPAEAYRIEVVLVRSKRVEHIREVL